MTDNPEIDRLVAPVVQCPNCSDLDEDCESIADKLHCWLYAPERGMCPFLRSTPLQETR